MEHHPFWKISLAEQVFSLTLETLEGLCPFFSQLPSLCYHVPSLFLSYLSHGAGLPAEEYTYRHGPKETELARLGQGEESVLLAFGLISTQAYRAPSSVPL